MTDALTDAIETVTARVTAISDPVERFKKARQARKVTSEADAQWKQLQVDAVNTLREGRTWAEVGELLDISGSRAEALAKGRSGHGSESTRARDKT